MRLLIAGCGDLGTRLGLLCLARGGEVHALRRRAQALPAGFNAIAADLSAPLPADLLGTPFDAVVCTVAAQARTPLAYQQAYIDAPKHVLAALPRPPARLLFVSSTAVYGEDDGSWVNETTPPAPAAFNGECLHIAERALANTAAKVTVARLSGIYGPGRERMWRRAMDGDPGTSRWGNRIHADDAAAALLHLLQLSVPPPLVCISDDRPARDDEVLARLREIAGLPIVPPAVSAAESGKRVSNRLLRDSGFRMQFPDFAAGYADLHRARLAAAALL